VARRQDRSCVAIRQVDTPRHHRKSQIRPSARKQQGNPDLDVIVPIGPRAWNQRPERPRQRVSLSASLCAFAPTVWISPTALSVNSEALMTAPTGWACSLTVRCSRLLMLVLARLLTRLVTAATRSATPSRNLAAPIRDSRCCGCGWSARSAARPDRESRPCRCTVAEQPKFKERAGGVMDRRTKA
jgi:hypothetical protein